MRSTDLLSIRQINREETVRKIEKAEGAMAHSTSALNSPLSDPTKDCTGLCTQYSVVNRAKKAEESVPCYCKASLNYY